MFPEIWSVQCAWCGTPMQVHKDCIDAALTFREGMTGPILVCGICAEGNTIVNSKMDDGKTEMLWLVRTDAESMQKMRIGLNSSGAAAYIKRRLN